MGITRKVGSQFGVIKDSNREVHRQIEDNHTVIRSRTLGQAKISDYYPDTRCDNHENQPNTHVLLGFEPSND